MVSRASLRRNGPRSGLSREVSERSWGFGESGGGFLAERVGDGLDREGEGDGSFLLGVLGTAGSGRLLDWTWVWGWIPGTEMWRGGASGGVLTETRSGMVTGLLAFFLFCSFSTQRLKRARVIDLERVRV
uniref:Kinesin light chain n=1 Tax=Rhizophora mucronata TaxID=61149 RepID=A0A2P2P8T7_RHIMU